MCFQLLSISVWLFNAVGTATNDLDLCALGHTTPTRHNYVINGNYTFQGYDSDNEDKPFWLHNLYGESLVIEWGFAYGVGNRYVLRYPANYSAYYGYCSVFDLLPYECNYQWNIWNGMAFVPSVNFQLHYCNYFEQIDNNNQCRNSTYLSQFGVREPFANGSICMSNAFYQPSMNGIYKYLGCSSGFPYFQHLDYINSNHTGYYIHWSWKFAFCKYCI